MWYFALLHVILFATPIICHNFITSMDPPGEVYDSIVVTSPPLQVNNNHPKPPNKRQPSNAPSPDYSIRFDKIQSENNVARRARYSDDNGEGFKKCDFNDFTCLYGSEDESMDNQEQQVIDKFIKEYSGITNPSFNDNKHKHEDEIKDEKSYWYGNPVSQDKHPYDDRQGWVTLDPVPWSKSQISKWHSNVQPVYPPAPQYIPAPPSNRPWSYGGPHPPHQPHQPHRPPHYPSYNSFSNDIVTDGKPSHFPNGNGGYTPHSPAYAPHQPALHYEAVFQNVNQYPQYNNRPVTSVPSSNHPATYPTEGNGQWVLLSTTKGYSLPQRTKDYGRRSFVFDTKTKFNSTFVTKDPYYQTDHGTSRRNFDISKYHEEELDNLKATNINSSVDDVKETSEDSKPMSYIDYDVHTQQNEPVEEQVTEATTALNGMKLLEATDGNSILVADKTDRSGKSTDKQLTLINENTNDGLKGDQPVMHFKRLVKLIVEPAANTTLAYDGMLEVDTPQQTVEESWRDFEKLEQLKKIANVKQSARGTTLRVVQVPVQRRASSAVADGATVLAAVGAGLVPATMAMLVPMALGRRRRSLQNIRQPLQEYK